MNPTPEMAFPNLLDLATAEAQAGTQQLMEQYKLQEFQQVSLDPHVGRLNFSDTVRFDIQVIGRYDPNVTTWQWAWADSTVPASTARAAAYARGFGQANEIAQLTTDQLSATEEECWRWTAFAARLVKWPAVYRLPLQNGLFVFLAIRPVPEGADAGLIPAPISIPS